jgi:hypothetical protein
MNDEAEKKLAPDTPADTLHAHVANHISLPEETALDNEPLMDEVTSHPNLQSHSIKELYSHATNHSSAPGTQETMHISSDQLSNLLNHPNAPLSVKQDYALKSWSPDNANSGLHQELADSGILDEPQLQTMSESALAAGQEPHAYKHISPAYFLKKFHGRSQQDPDTLDDAEKEKWANEIRLGHQGLIDSSKHNPQTLEQTIDAFANAKHGPRDNTGMLNDLVQGREDLSKDQLNKIHQIAESSSDDSHYKDNLLDSILEHKNVDPTLLAKYAVGKKAKAEALSHPNLPRESIKSFISRVTEPNKESWYDNGQKDHIKNLLKNPQLTKDDVNALIKKGSLDALNDERADEGHVRAHWNKTDKGLEAARSILHAKNVPPDVLKELVNHKNQEVAINALQHPKADMEVVQEGLKRKAKAVSDEARLHPLVAATEARNGLMSGKVGLTKAYEDADYAKHFDQMPAADQEKVFQAADEKYRGDNIETVAKKTKERPENVIFSKYKLASDPRAPKALRDSHALDLSNMFRDKIGKNSEPNETSRNILSDDHKSDNGRIIKAVVSLAKDGNKEAQSAILENPGMMHALSDHVKFDELPSNFIEDLYGKMRQHMSDGTTVLDRYGEPKPFNSRADVSDAIFASKNTPTHVFQEIAADPKLMEAIGQGDQLNRYNDLPEAEQVAKYQQIMESGSPEARLSILRAKAPRQSWDAAFSGITPEARNKFLENNIRHVQKHRPDVFKNTALGVYNTEERAGRHGNDPAQVKALNNLNPQLLEDRATAKQALQIPEGSSGHLKQLADREGYGSLLPKAMYAHDYELADHAFSINRPDIGYEATVGKFKQDIADAPYASGNSATPENQAEVQNTIAQMQQRVEQMPMPDASNPPTDNPTAFKWNEILHKMAGRNTWESGDLDGLKRRGGNLDFLADMPGADGEALKKSALAQNLISSEKLAQIASAGTMQDVLAVGDGNKRQQMLQGFLKNPNVSEQDLRELAQRINHSYLNPEAFGRGRRTSMSPTALETYNQRLNNLIDAYQEKAPDALPDLLKNVTRNGDRNIDLLTQADTDAISKNIINHIKTKPYATPSDKSANLYGVLKSLGIQGSGGAAGVTLRSLEKEAIANNDINLMIRMANNRDLTDSGVATLSKIASQPNTLNATQIADLSQTLDYDSSTQSVVGMAQAFETKIAAEPQSPKTAAMKEKFNKGIYNTLSFSSDANKETNAFAINYIKRAALDPATEKSSNSYLAHITSQLSGIDLNQSLDLYDSLPDDLNKFATPPVMGLTENMVNHPRFMESSHSGWRLGALAAHADKLTGNNASILVNRALSDAGAQLDKKSLFHSLETNEFTQSADSIKLARSMSANDFNTLVKQLTQGRRANTLSGNVVFAAHARLQDLQAAIKDPNLVAPNAPPMGDEHRNHIVYNAHALSSVVQGAKFDDEVNGMKDKTAKVSEIITTLHDNLSQVANAISEQAQASPSDLRKSDLSRDNEYILSTAENLASTGLKLDRGDALKVMDLVGKYNDNRSIMGTDKDFSETSQVVSNIVKRAENFEEQDWKQAFDADPHAPFYLSQREAIPSEALNSIDFKAIEDHADPEFENSHDQKIQSAFATESTKWFQKMSAEDLNSHGKNLLHMYSRMQNDGKIDLRRFNDSMSEGMKYVGNQLDHKEVMQLLDATKDHQVKQDLYRKAVINGVGGKETYKSFVRDDHNIKDLMSRNMQEMPRGEGSNIRQKLEPMIKSPHIDEESADKVMSMFNDNPSIMKESAVEMMKNKATPRKAVSDLASFLTKNHKDEYKQLNQRMSSDIASEVMQHPNVDEQQMVELFNLSNEEFPKFFAPNGRFNPALTNGTHGGRLFRSMPVVVPEDVPNVSTSQVVKNVSLQHKDYKRMQEVMALVPPEGIAWAEFKRKYPEQEKSLPQSVKAVFTSAQNKPVMPEQFAQALRTLDDNSKKYHLTYSHWTSDLQKHRPESKPNLVVQVNNSEESEKNLSQDPKLWALYQKLLLQTNGISGQQMGLHPTTPHLVSWSRVDTDQSKDSWAIEEYQSDMAQKFRKNLRSLMSQFPSGANINGHVISRSDMEKYAKQIDKHLEDWGDASMQAVIENAKAHGVTKLYMHGAELRGMMSGGYGREFWDNPNTKPKTVGFRKIYQDAPPRFGFKECEYTDYPKSSSKMLKRLQDAKLSTKCWVLDLSEPKPKRARKPKPNLE